MEENRPGYYAIIPADVRYDDKLPANAKLLYGEISSLIGKDGFCYASNTYFAEIYQCSVETVSRWVSKLVKEGYIIREEVRDSSGQIVQRKLFLKTSVPDIQPLDKKINTSPQKNQEGIDKKVKETNTSITNIEKENIKEKGSRRRAALTDEQLEQKCVSWIREVAGEDWTRKGKNDLYASLMGFYAPRENAKQEPAKTEAGFSGLTRQLLRYSEGSPTVMVELLDKATVSGWKSVYPPKGGLIPVCRPQVTKEGEEWL